MDRQLLLECPNCLVQFNLKKHVVDKRVRCRKCKKTMIIPPLPGEAAKPTPAPQDIDPDRQKKLRKVHRIRNLFLASSLLLLAVAGAIYVLVLRIEARPVFKNEKPEEGPMSFSKLLQENGRSPLPLAIGFEWKYEGKKKAILQRRVVSSHVGPTDEPQFEMVVADGSEGVRYLIRATNDGPLLLDEQPTQGTKTTYDPPLLMVPRNLYKESKWNYRGEVTRGNVTEEWELDFKVVKVEPVTTYLGTHSCLRVHITGRKGAKKVDDTVWYALGIGPVRFVRNSSELMLRHFAKPGK